jgi:hypothetical protein
MKNRVIANNGFLQAIHKTVWEISQILLQMAVSLHGTHRRLRSCSIPWACSSYTTPLNGNSIRALA